MLESSIKVTVFGMVMLVIFGILPKDPIAIDVILYPSRVAGITTSPLNVSLTSHNSM